MFQWICSTFRLLVCNLLIKSTWNYYFLSPNSPFLPIFCFNSLHINLSRYPIFSLTLLDLFPFIIWVSCLNHWRNHRYFALIRLIRYIGGEKKLEQNFPFGSIHTQKLGKSSVNNPINRAMNTICIVMNRTIHWKATKEKNSQVEIIMICTACACVFPCMGSNIKQESH